MFACRSCTFLGLGRAVTAIAKNLTYSHAIIMEKPRPRSIYSFITLYELVSPGFHVSW